MSGTDIGGRVATVGVVGVGHPTQGELLGQFHRHDSGRKPGS
jgi:hypothetical protein